MNAETIPPASAIELGIRWATGVVGRELVDSGRLDATSSTVVALADDAGRGFVLRLLTNRSWLDAEPDLAVHEAAALELAASLSLPTPALVDLDPEGEHAGVPAVLMTRLPGRPRIPSYPDRAWLRLLAEIPAETATADTTALAWNYSPWIADSPVLPVRDRGAWERAHLAVAEGLPVGRRVVLHRDHHPMNVLCHDGGLTGVVDWINACVGPAPADIGHCRINLVAMYGLEAADTVRDHWRRLTGEDYDPAWDLVSLLGTLPVAPYPPWGRHGLNVAQPVMEERLGRLLERALAELGV